MGNLTALKVKNAKPGRYSDGNGLSLLVKPSGGRSWVLRIQKNGKRHDYGLGSAVPLKGLTLADARQRAYEIRMIVESGGTPPSRRRNQKSDTRSTPTFKQACQTVHQERAEGWKNKRHTDSWLTTLEHYAWPEIGEMQIDQIEANHVLKLLTPIWLSKAETARRVKQRVGAVLDWAHASGFRQTEAPMRSINKGLPRQPRRDNHMAAMPYEDLPAFMRDLRQSDTMGRLALRFTILTAARSGEVRGATWKEMDLKEHVWKVPADRMKAGREHLSPLNDEALEILKIASQISTHTDDQVFPGARNRPLSDMTLTKVLRDACIPDFTVHGFRSSFRDWAAEKTSYAGEIVESALAHTVANKVEAAYRRTNYLEKRRDLMADWAIYLQKPSQ